MGSTLYFAYGSNMAAERLHARIGRFERVCIGALGSHRLVFHKPSLGDGSGKCDATFTDHAADRVLGVVYALPETTLPVLDRFEGCGMGYERRRMRIRRLAGDVLEAEIYVATRTDPSLRPFDWYKEHVLRGARSAGLPPEYVAEIEAVATDPDPDPGRRRRELAIYHGTLMPQSQ